MAGAFSKLLKVGATAAGTAVGGPVGGMIGSGLSSFGTSLAGGNGLGQSLLAGGMSAAGNAIAPKAPGVSAPMAPDASPHFEGIPSLSIDSSLMPPGGGSLLDTLRMRRGY